MALSGIQIHERMKHFKVPGMSMTQICNGKIHSEAYGVIETETNKRVKVNSMFNACSISKFVTSMLVMRLSEQGLLDLDEDVNNRLISWKVPENEWTQNKKVTLRNILSHQSGLIDHKNSFGELDSDHSIPTMLELLEGSTSYCSEPIQVKVEPESQFHYSDAGFCIIEQLIEDVSGKPFKLMMDEFIFELLNMTNSSYDYVIPNMERNHFSCGHHKDGGLVKGKYPIYPYSAASGLWTTPEDLSKLVIELMDSLNGTGKLGLSKSTVTEMITPQGCANWTGLGFFLDNSGQISSLGWGVGFQCMMVAYPYLKTGAVVMTNIELGIHQNEGIIGEIIEALSSELSGVK